MDWNKHVHLNEPAEWTKDVWIGETGLDGTNHQISPPQIDRPKPGQPDPDLGIFGPTWELGRPEPALAELVRASKLVKISRAVNALTHTWVRLKACVPTRGRTVLS